ncbi:MAG: preprotein translocase subunit SecE [Tepidisphaeraceae bacterium]
MSFATQNKEEIAVADAIEEQEERELPVVREQKHGFLTIYKYGQGYWTRMGTAIGALLIIVVLGVFTYQQSGTFTQNKSVIAGITAVVSLAGVLVAWVLMNKPQNAEFLIATDVEMKKVSWGTREELIGSTRVVILFLFMLVAILFAIDVITGLIFQSIGLLKVGLLS